MVKRKSFSGSEKSWVVSSRTSEAMTFSLTFLADVEETLDDRLQADRLLGDEHDSIPVDGGEQ
jgi:hypothetical protein